MPVRAHSPAGIIELRWTNQHRGAEEVCLPGVVCKQAWTRSPVQLQVCHELYESTARGIKRCSPVLDPPCQQFWPFAAVMM